MTTNIQPTKLPPAAADVIQVTYRDELWTSSIEKVSEVGSVNPHIGIHTKGQRTPGGAYSSYEIVVNLPVQQRHIRPAVLRDSCAILTKFEFQNGDPAVHGVNGLTNEALLRVVQDRLEGFLEGSFADVATHAAHARVVDALRFLALRTRERELRGVEGQQVP